VILSDAAAAAIFAFVAGVRLAASIWSTAELRTDRIVSTRLSRYPERKQIASLAL
jgi:hypothetical protein